MSTDGDERKIAHRYVVESPARNCGSLRDGPWVPGQVKDGRKCEMFVAEETHSVT